MSYKSYYVVFFSLLVASLEQEHLVYPPDYLSTGSSIRPESITKIYNHSTRLIVGYKNPPLNEKIAIAG